jgi:hypothetical protein
LLPFSKTFSGLASEFEKQITVLLLPSSSLDAASTHQRRSDWREEFLSVPDNSVFSAPVSAVMPELQQLTVTPSALTPVCHASNSSCVTASNNCSGHGYCYLKYASKDEAIASDCYACKCVQTLVQNPDGTVKTVQWGGAACQKKDVSTPFFLVAGITILLLVAVGNGMRLLFSVGQENLPSVIGAGVGNSRAPK